MLNSSLKECVALKLEREKELMTNITQVGKFKNLEMLGSESRIFKNKAYSKNTRIV